MFSKYPMSGSLYFVDVELIQIEKTALYCAMFFYITKMLLITVLNSATARQFRDKIFKILYIQQYRISSMYVCNNLVLYSR